MNPRHGQTRNGRPSKLWHAWHSMRQRCNNPKHAAYHNYGGRGIKVHPEWDSSFEAFARDVPTAPSGRHQLDRRDNERGYVPGNIKWSTPREQLNNTRMNHILEHDGIRDTIAGWARRLGINHFSLRYRIKRWPIEKALTVPYSKSNTHGRI